jgi:sulfatase modifying factor 1
MGVARNPQEPDSAYDPSDPGGAKKGHRGGSFFCTDQCCSRYMVGTHGKGDVDTGTNRLGFRCVMTLQQWTQHRKGQRIARHMASDDMTDECCQRSRLYHY